jgi:hypothetical protein
VLAGPAFSRLHSPTNKCWMGITQLDGSIAKETWLDEVKRTIRDDGTGRGPVYPELRL